MELYGLEKLSLVDYDGKVASTVFTGSCNFKCGFCHNGELVTEADTLKTISEDYALDYFRSRKNILDGVCISGGEPTLQKDLPEFCEKIKNVGLSVKLDTNGTNFNVVKSLAENGLVDYFAMDVKNSLEKYPLTTGVKNPLLCEIEKTIDFFLSGGCDYEFRTTIIKEYHTKNDLVSLAKRIKGAKRYFLQKFKNVDTCIDKTLNEIPLCDAEDYLSAVKEFVPSAQLRGY